VKEARVVDYMAFATYLVTYGLTTQPEECRNPDLKFALDKLATKFIHHKDVAEIPGIVITEEQVARR
jgi:hypothetical protein